MLKRLDGETSVEMAQFYFQICSFGMLLLSVLTVNCQVKRGMEPII